MSLTLGLNTALSGLMTNQRGLDVIAQNVVNVNTVGYSRKVMTPESRVLAGRGAGVQDGGLTRMVNEGLLKDIRRQTSSLGRLEVEQQFYPRIDDLFGEVGDNNSIAHKLNEVSEAFELLAADVNKPSAQWSTAQTTQDAADLLKSMTEQLQQMRLEADSEIEKVVGLINDELNNIHEYNQQIVKNSAVASGTTDIEDKRDQSLTKLANYLDIQYYKRNDGSVLVYTNSGQMLVDNAPQLLSHSANNVVQSWMTAGGGHFGAISVAGGASDLTDIIGGGQLRALIDMRDKVIPNLQGSLDEMAVTVKEELNLVHNRGTSFPNIKSRYEGTRVFANQPTVVPNAADAAPTLTIGTATSLTSADFTTLGFAANAAEPWRTTLTAAAGTPFAAGTFAVGTVFSISDATNSANNGSYRVTGWTSTSQITVEKVNASQTMQLSGTEDVSIVLFDSNGNQTASTTLNTIMQTNYSGSYTAATVGTNRSLSDFAAQGDRADWSINQVSAHVEAWLSAQGYTSASVNLDSDGKMVMDVGDSTVTLAFRDQTATANGSSATDATIAFDSNGDGATDQTVKGFSNFFGLNDFLVSSQQNAIFDSRILASSFTTSTSRTLTLADGTGKVGNTISVPAGSSLSDIAEAINRHGQVSESAPLTSTTFTTTTAATITVASGANSVYTPVTIPAGTFTLDEIAGLLTQSTVTATVVQDGASKRLRLTDSRGEPLTVTISGGATGTGSLGTALSMSSRNRISASVVPEGSGYRLRVVQDDNKEMYLSSTLDGLGKNLLSDLGLERAATGVAGSLDVRDDILGNSQNISRGKVQWNSDLSVYYVSPGDNSSAHEMAVTMTTKQTLDSAGDLASGSYSFAEYTAATIGVVARQSSYSKDRLDYQTKLNQSLDFQHTSFSGVNLDEEVSSMIDFQQAYSASAKVITVLQEMLETLTSMIR